MKILTLNTSSVKVAENWNELNKKQLLKITNLLYNKELKLSVTQWKYAIIYQVMNIRWFDIRFVYNFIMLPKTDVVYSLFPLIKWLEKGNTLTDFKINHLTLWFSKYYAPKDGMINITIDEFRYLDPFYVRYKKTGDLDSLDGLVSILYRKKRDNYNPKSAHYNGDVREDFNVHQIVANSIKMSKLSLTKKQLIYLTYEGARNEIIESCPHLFSKDEVKKQGKSFGYGGLILELSGEKFGDFEKTCKTNLITAFNFLEMESIKNEKRRQQ